MSNGGHRSADSIKARQVLDSLFVLALISPFIGAFFMVLCYNSVMSNFTESKCLRGREDCTPLSNLSSDDDECSFICVGYNKKDTREVEQDRFTLCWKNNVIDERGHWDRRDLLDTQSVIAQALSTDENIRVNENETDEGMNKIEFV